MAEPLSAFLLTMCGFFFSSNKPIHCSLDKFGMDFLCMVSLSKFALNALLKDSSVLLGGFGFHLDLLANCLCMVS